MKRLFGPASTAALMAGGIALSGTSAHANVEVGATAGIHVFSVNNELGVADVANAESLRNSALFGLRFGYYFTPMLGVEAEAGAIPTEPRGMVFDVWNLSYRGQVVAQFRAADPTNKFVPFVLAGAGVVQVLQTDDDATISKDTDEIFYGGIGVKYRVDNGWGLRLDVRGMVVPTSEPKDNGDPNKGPALDGEALLSVYKEWGRPAAEKPVVVPDGPKDTDGDGLMDDVDKCVNDAEDPDSFEDEDGCPDTDNDKDGVLDVNDKCPMEAEDLDGFQDDDGCPETDNDSDGLLDAADKCPNEAEDMDGFNDEDGCPDPDNDNDGVLDVNDKCPAEPETVNGFQDSDGCPDEIPAAVKKFTGVIKGINFKTGSAEILKTSNKTLNATIKILNDFPDIKLEIQGHTDDLKLKKGSTFADNTELSQARAESVKAYFVAQGIADDRVVAKGFGSTAPIDPRKTKAARAKNRRVEFRLISSLDVQTTPGTPTPEASGTPPTPTPTPTPTPEPTPAPTPTP
jgi:outer membrane protein OmpA-like peptidoglycan-associated protein/outer membrane protein W